MARQALHPALLALVAMALMLVHSWPLIRVDVALLQAWVGGPNDYERLAAVQAVVAPGLLPLSDLQSTLVPVFLGLGLAVSAGAPARTLTLLTIVLAGLLVAYGLTIYFLSEIPVGLVTFYELRVADIEGFLAARFREILVLFGVALGLKGRDQAARGGGGGG